MISHIFESENSLLINCNDKSVFLINILESKFAFMHHNRDESEMDKYLETHSDEEVVKELLSVTKCHPTFLSYFMIFKKLEEKGIIDEGIFYHIMDSMIQCESEFEELMVKLINYFMKMVDYLKKALICPYPLRVKKAQRPQH